MFKRYLLFFILVFLIGTGPKLGTGPFLLGRGSENGPVPNLYAQEENKQVADQQINDFSLVGFGDKGKKTWDLFAKSADIFTDIIKLKDITANLYGEKEDIRLTSDRGDFDKVRGNVHLEQNVVITTSSGGRLTTNSLDWDREEEIVTTKEIVNIEKDNLFSVARGATAVPDLNKITLEKEVTVEIKSAKKQGQKEQDEKDKIIITCDGPLQIDYEKNIATFKNNVKVDAQKDVEIYGDIMYAYFSMSDEEANDKDQSSETPTIMGSNIEKIITQGNVKIIGSGNTSYSDEAIYSALDKKITLLGRPKLIIYSTEGLGASFGD